MYFIFAVPFVDFFGGITVPCIRSLFSKTVGKEEQGMQFHLFVYSANDALFLLFFVSFTGCQFVPVPKCSIQPQ